MNNEVIEAYWSRFLEETGREKSLRYLECFHFDLTEEWADKLLELTLAGKKRATATSLHYFENNSLALPRAGDCSIVTDWAGNPRCVIKTTAVTVLPFRDVTWEICRREGEDDNLASWQLGHVNFFTAEGEREGYAFSWDMPVVFEDFAVVYK